MPDKDWHLKMKPQEVEVKSDPIENLGSGHDRILRQIDVAYQGDENTTPQEVVNHFMPVIKQMAAADGLTIADEDVEFPVKASRVPVDPFRWRIVALLRPSKASSKNPYFGSKDNDQMVRRTPFAQKGIRSVKPRSLDDLFKKPPVPPA